MKTVISHEGQKYVDDPVYETVMPKAELVTQIADSVARVFGHRAPKPISWISGYKHTRLRWMRLDGQGKLVPLR